MAVRRKRRRRRGKRLRRQLGGQLELTFPLVPLDKYARDMVAWRAAQLSYRPPFKPWDRKDLEQELALDLMRRAARWDPRRGTWRGFVCRVVYNGMATLLTNARVQRLGWQCQKFSLNEFVRIAEEEYATREEIIEVDQDVDQCHDAWRTTDLRVDLELALDALPPRLKAIALRMPNETPTEIARAMGLTTTQVKRDIARLRQLLRIAGLSDYLPSNANPEMNHEQ